MHNGHLVILLALFYICSYVRTPVTAADALIELPDGRIVLVRRRNPPAGWAIPGGFIEAGESAEKAAIREAREETGLDVRLGVLLGVYSEPSRDPRHHTLTIVYTATASGTPVGGDDAAEARAFDRDSIPGNLAFDHPQILADYFELCRSGKPPPPRSGNRLPTADRKLLLAVARHAIESHLGLRSPTPASSRVLESLGAAFVSLHRNGDLRGCIGTLSFDEPLASSVARSAHSAAFEDPRFSPLRSDELSGLSLEISILARPRPALPGEVIAGLHGVALELGSHRATFLPRVAREQGWTRRQLLEETCLKAGLPADAWRDPALRLEVFTSETVADDGGTRKSGSQPRSYVLREGDETRR